MTQAQCMKTETEHYRRLQSELVQVRFVYCYVVQFSCVDNLEGSGLEGRLRHHGRRTTLRGLGPTTTYSFVHLNYALLISKPDIKADGDSLVL